MREFQLSMGPREGIAHGCGGVLMVKHGEVGGKFFRKDSHRWRQIFLPRSRRMDEARDTDLKTASSSRLVTCQEEYTGVKRRPSGTMY